MLSKSTICAPNFSCSSSAVALAATGLRRPRRGARSVALRATRETSNDSMVAGAQSGDTVNGRLLYREASECEAPAVLQRDHSQKQTPGVASAALRGPPRELEGASSHRSTCSHSHKACIPAFHTQPPAEHEVQRQSPPRRRLKTSAALHTPSSPQTSRPQACPPRRTTRPQSPSPCCRPAAPRRRWLAAL